MSYSYDRRDKTASNARRLVASLHDFVDGFERKVKDQGLDDYPGVDSAIENLKQSANGVHHALSRHW